ncbi:hypothetical protein HFN20_08990 [Paenibacillus dendritiformis]|uniref:hypothetical protein n=1 Tax=Paenibacillus dendritiformis TaxID=130049 RepID=UPI00143D2F92|nr:hypothetical protein [Paenibacillus dendritiformis]NKI21357.1 hypothetical protein [Paenibacillus dendritiformis]NRG00890.1 hypothetical protein [Paenibacillus dendritiformis]
MLGKSRRLYCRCWRTTVAAPNSSTTAKVEKPDGSYVRHEYDSEGLRSGICENGVTSRFVFDG